MSPKQLTNLSSDLAEPTINHSTLTTRLTTNKIWHFHQLSKSDCHFARQSNQQIVGLLLRCEFTDRHCLFVGCFSHTTTDEQLTYAFPKKRPITNSQSPSENQHRLQSHRNPTHWTNATAHSTETPQLNQPNKAVQTTKTKTHYFLHRSVKSRYSWLVVVLDHIRWNFSWDALGKKKHGVYNWSKGVE